MAKRKKRNIAGLPYLDLGNLLRTWREQKFSSASALFRDHEFSFSYSTYASFENGINLPAIPQLLELAEKLGQDPADAALTWAKVQMPTPELQALFRSRTSGPKREKQIANPPALDTVWILSPKEQEHVLKFPWLTELFRRLCSAYPNSIRLDRIEVKNLSRAAFLNECVLPLTHGGFLHVESDSLRLQLPHIHIPENEIGKKIRRAVLQNTFDEFSTKLGGEGAQDLLFHNHISRRFTKDQAQRWQVRLETLSEEFYALPFSQDETADSATYTFLTLFGKRT